MNDEKMVMREENPTPVLPQNEDDFGEGEKAIEMKNDEQPSPCPLPSVGEGKKTVYNGFERLPYHPNRHDRRKAAAIARKERKK